MTSNGFNLVTKTHADASYTFEVPAFEGEAEDIADRYGLEVVVKAFCQAKTPTQTISKMLKEGSSPEEVQDWLNDWTPGSRARVSPAERLMREADKLGVDRSEIQTLLAKAAKGAPAKAA